MEAFEPQITRMGFKWKSGILQPVLPTTLLLLLSLCVIASARHQTSNIATSNTTNTTTTANSTYNYNTIHHITRRNEISLRLRRDRLREFRIAFHDVLVLETSPLPHHPAPAGAVSLLQVTDGKQVVHTVRKDNVIKDCRWSSEAADIAEFIQEYIHGAPRRPRNRNVLKIYDNQHPEMSLISNSTHRLRHREMRGDPLFRPRRWNVSRMYEHPNPEISLTSNSTHRLRHRHWKRRDPLYRGVFRKVRRSESLGHFTSYLQVARQVRECQEFQSQVRQILGVSGNGSRREKRSSSSGGRRKRDLMTGWFIFPGTKWCGAGDIAEHPNDLGYDEALDTCCRDHDLCPHIIHRFSWKYGLFNFHLHTLSHCRCDRRFRRCLKKSKSPAAHMVGKIFFNVVGSKCFKFTRERACKRRDWWGKCKKYGFTKVAHPRKQRAF